MAAGQIAVGRGIGAVGGTGAELYTAIAAPANTRRTVPACILLTAFPSGLFAVFFFLSILW